VYSAALFDSLDSLDEGVKSFDNAGDIDKTSRTHPLTEELNALNELVGNIQMDLLQTSMLVEYVKNYLDKQHFSEKF
jgi:hypothetical protein